MGFGDNLKQIGEGIVDIVKAPFGLAWDLVRAIPDKEYNPGSPMVPVGEALTSFTEGIAKFGAGTGLSKVGEGLQDTGLANALGWIFHEGELLYNTEYQRTYQEPPLGLEKVFPGLDPGELSIQRAGATIAGTVGGLVPGGESPNPITQYEYSSNRTPGQAVVESIASNFWGIPFAEMPKEQQDEIRAQTWYSMVSGTLDAATRWFTQPEVIAGKSIKVARQKFNPSFDDMLKRFQKTYGMDAGHLPDIEATPGAINLQIKNANGQHVYHVTRTSNLDDIQSQGLWKTPEGTDLVREGDTLHRGFEDLFHDRLHTLDEDQIENILSQMVERHPEGPGTFPETLSNLFAGDPDFINFVNWLNDGSPANKFDYDGFKRMLDGLDDVDAFAWMTLVEDTFHMNISDWVMDKMGGKVPPVVKGLSGYPIPEERSIYLLGEGDLDEAYRYAAALYDLDSQDLPIILKINPEGLPVVFEDFIMPHMPDPRSGRPMDASLITKADKISGENIVDIIRPGTADLDTAFTGGLDEFPHYLEPGGRVHDKLYNPDGSAIEPGDILHYDEVEEAFNTATNLYNTEGGEASVRFLKAWQFQQRGPQADNLVDYIMGSKQLQRALNWMDGKNADQIRRRLFPQHTYGQTLSSMFADARNYGERRLIMASAVGLRLPEQATLGPMAQARINLLTKEMDDFARDPRFRVGVRAVETGMMDDIAEQTLDDLHRLQQFYQDSISEMERQAQLGNFLSEIAIRAPLRRPPRLTATGYLRQAIRETDFWQESPLARPLRTVTEWKPRQFLNIHDPMGDIQIVRQLEEAQSLGISASEISDFRQQFMGATAEHEKVLVVMRVEDRIIRAAAKKAGLPADQIEQVIAISNRGKATTYKFLQSRRYSPDHDMDIIRWVDDGTGEIVEMALPILGTQLQNWIPLTDIRELKRISGKLGAFYQRFGKTARIPTELMDSFYHLWKPTVLLRGGWPIRVVGDEQLRILAKTGSLIKHLAAIEAGEIPKWTGIEKGLPGGVLAGRVITAPASIATSFSARAASAVSRLARKLKRVDEEFYELMEEAGVEKMASARASHSGPHESINQEFQALLGIHEQGIFDHLFTSGSGQWMTITPQDKMYGAAWQRALKDQLGRDPLVRKIVEEFTGAPRVHNPVRRFLKSFDPELAARIPDEQLDELYNILHNHYGDWLDEESALLAQTGGEWPYVGGIIDDLESRMEIGIGDYLDSLGIHEREYDIRAMAEETATRFFEGEWDKVAIGDPRLASQRSAVDWLKNTPQGREYAKRLPWRANNLDKWVNDVDGLIGIYTGDYNPTLLDAMLEGKVTQDMLSTIDEHIRPSSVHAEIIDQTLGTSAVSQFMREMLSTNFDILGRLPTDTLSRQSFFREMYAEEMMRIRRVARAQGLDVDNLDETTIGKMSAAARDFSIEQVRTYLYDLAETSRFGQMTRWFFPFYPAWQEVLKVWGKLAWADPSVIGRAKLIWQAPNQANLITKDEEGNEYITFRLSEKMSDNLGLTGWSEYLAKGGVRFGKSSFNLVTNSPLPGVGPPIQVLVNTVVKNKPELEEAVRFLLPYGVKPNIKEVLLSPIMRRVDSVLSSHEGDRQYQRDWTNVMTWLDFRYRSGESSMPPSYSEVKELADKLFVVRLIANLISPSQPILDSPLKPYTDVYRELIEGYGPEVADEIFLQQYGAEFFSVTISRTVSRTGISPTVEGQLARQQYEDLIQKYPEWGRFIIGDEALGEFSSAAFAWQLSNPMDPENPYSPPEREYRMLDLDPRTGTVMEVDRRLGWAEYIKAMDTIEVARKQMGFPSLRVKEAESLSLMKKQITQVLAEKYPGWWDDFNTRDDLKWDNRITALREISSTTLMDDRPDMQGVQEYLFAREAILGELNRRKQLGGASTLDAVANQDVAALWEAMIGQVLSDNIAFAPIYFRYLEGDPVRLK